VSGIAEQLDAKLKTLDAKAASSLEQLVRDAIQLVDSQNGTAAPDRLPADFFTRISREFGSEPFERPPQGEFEKREAW
jgi:hypothetical protein